jgi:zinc protease
MFVHQVSESTLPNGLKLITAENPASPTVSTQLYYKVGSRNERTGLTGISHILEHLMFKGTARFPEGAFDRIVQENGMTYNAFTSHDFTCYFESMAADRLEVALELEADRMQGLILEEEGFRSEMAVIREERRQMVEDPPGGLVSEAVQAAAFTVHPYHWPVIGWMTDLENMTLEAVLAYYRDYYRPNNAVLVVAGDLSHERVVELVQAKFGSIAPGPDSPAQRIQEPPQRGERTVAIHKAVQLPILHLAYRAPASQERASKILNVIEFLLLHGRSSRLYKKLIYREQLATGIGGGIHLRIDPSLFDLRATARPGISIERLRDAVYDALDQLSREAVTAEELQKVRNAIEADFVFSQESNAELGQNLGEDECRSSWRDYFTWLDDQLTVTPEEIMEVARETFSPRSRTVGYLVPDAESEAAGGDSMASGGATASADPGEGARARGGTGEGARARGDRGPAGAGAAR